MKYILIKRNKSISANSNTKFIRWMRQHDLQNWDSNQDFIEGYAYRKKAFDDINIRCDSEDHFIEDLQKNNLLRIESSRGFMAILKKLTNK